MGTFRHTAASVVAASAVLLTGQPGVASPAPVAASQAPRQGFRAAAQIAADVYRQERRSILERYRQASRDAHHDLRFALMHAQTAAERQAAWRAYADTTAPLRAEAHSQMQAARTAFRDTVEQARSQFGVATEPSISTHVRVVDRRRNGEMQALSELQAARQLDV